MYKKLILVFGFLVSSCSVQYMTVPKVSPETEEWTHSKINFAINSFLKPSPMIVEALEECHFKIKSKFNSNMGINYSQDDVDSCMLSKGFVFNFKGLSGQPPCKVNPERKICNR
jgi:hypothetical protein